MYKSPVRFPRFGRSRRRYIVLDGETLLWLPDSLPGTEPLGSLRLDASSTVELLSSTTLTLRNSAGDVIMLTEIDVGDAAAWVAALERCMSKLPGHQQSVTTGNAPLLATQPASDAPVRLLKLKDVGMEELVARWGPEFREELSQNRRSPLGLLRSCKWFFDFFVTVAIPMLALREVVVMPNYQLVKWTLAGETHLPHAATVTLSDLGVRRDLTSPFFPSRDPTVLTYGKSTSRLIILLPSLIQLMIISLLLAEELRTATEGLSLRAGLCPMESGVVDTVASVVLFITTLRATLESSHEWLVIGFITSLKDKGLANDALALAALLDEVCQLLLTLTLSLLFIGERSLMELAFNCVALIFIMEIDNLLIKGTFQQAMASDRLRHLTADVTTTDLFLFTVAPPDRWSPFGVHYASCTSFTRRLHGFFRRWVRPLNFGFIPFVAPAYVLMCRLGWPKALPAIECIYNVTLARVRFPP